MPLKTVRVPRELEGDFLTAEDLVSRYFSERSEDPTRGSIEISGERYVLVRAASLSVEFFSLVEKLYGAEREAEAHDFARNILFDLAHALGKSDARAFAERMDLADPVARLSAGPVHFAHTGWASVDISGESKPVPGPGYCLIYDHPYAFESAAWRRAGRTVDFPVCIMNAGYSSGWCEESFGIPLVAAEVLCTAKGDEVCRFIMAPPDEIEEHLRRWAEDRPSLQAGVLESEIPDFFSRKRVEEELRSARDDLERRVAARTADLHLAAEQLRKEMEMREHIERQLQKTQRLESLGRLAGGVAHDFNNLLGVIMGYSSILEGRIPGDDPLHTMVSEITHAARLAANLTRQLLTFSRSQVTTKRLLDINEIAGEVASMLRPVLGDDIVLETNLCHEHATVEADSSQIEQMLMNLAVNARDAMPQGGRIRISTLVIPGDGDGDGTVRLSVDDDGVGMDAVTQSKIFDPFFTTKTGAEGTGLGLSTVYGIVTQAGGTVTVESAPGQGARFDIDLPRRAVDPDGVPRGQTRRPRGRSGETVLLVEDRISFRALVAQILEGRGYTVLVSHDTGDALRISEQYPETIHLLLTDVEMPDHDGKRVAEAVLERRPGMAVLFMSGYAGGHALVDAALAQRAGFIRKPFLPDELEEELRRLLDARPPTDAPADD